MFSFSKKDKYVRIYIFILGVILLIAINSIFIFYIFYPKYIYGYIIIVLVLAYIYWTKYSLFKSLRYELDKDKFFIKFNKKVFIINLSDIKNLEKVKKHSFWKGWGIKYNFLTKDVYYTTSINDLVRLKLKDGKNIIISPKKDFLKKLKQKIRNEKN